LKGAIEEEYLFHMKKLLKTEKRPAENREKPKGETRKMTKGSKLKFDVDVHQHEELENLQNLRGGNGGDGSL
jgi:hypothetical protein